MHVCIALTLNLQTLKIRILLLYLVFKLILYLSGLLWLKVTFSKCDVWFNTCIQKPKRVSYWSIDFWGQLWWFQTLKLLLTTILFGQWQSHAIIIVNIQTDIDWLFNNKYKLTGHHCSTMTFLTVMAPAKRFKMCVVWPALYLRQN